MQLDYSTKYFWPFNAVQKSLKQKPAQDANLLWGVPTSHTENTESETRWFFTVQKQSPSLLVLHLLQSLDGRLDCDSRRGAVEQK